MSEPSSLIVRCQITEDGLRRWLRAREPLASGFTDWNRLAYDFTPGDLANLDASTDTSVSQALLALRDDAEVGADWLFSYDAASQDLTIGQCYFDENWFSYVIALTPLRRLGAFITAEQHGGRIYIYDWWWGTKELAAAVSLYPGGSAIIAAEDVDDDVEAVFDEILSPVAAAAERGLDEPIRDDLDRFIESS